MRNQHLAHRKWNNKFLATAIACAMPIASVHASGFRIPEVSAAGTASANALVATTDELGAVAYNPAVISFHEGKAAMLGVNYINIEFTVTPTAPNTSVETKGNGKNDHYAPNLLLSTVGDNNWGFVMLVNAPFGLETSWPAGTFDSFAGPLAVFEPALSRIVMLNYNPNMSYKLDESSSVSFGLDYYDVSDLTFNTQAIKINGSGGGMGWNVGLIKKMGAFTFGASYRSAVNTDITGTFNTSALGPPTGTALGAKAKLEFPDIFQMGLHYQATDALGIEFDVDRTGWSSFDQIRVESSTGGAFTTSTNNWKNIWAYRLGMSLKLGTNTKLMLGYSYDNTPQPDEYFSARVPDADRQLFSIGASHDIGGWILQYSYMYVDVDTRNVNSGTGFAGGDPNGTTAYNGKYETDLYLIGLSLGTTF